MRARALGVMVAMACVGCARELPPPIVTTDAAAAESRACSLVPGVTQRSVTVNGTERRYLLSVGSVAARKGTPPVLFLWHGFGSNAREMIATIEAERDWPEGIVVAAQGLGRRLEGAGIQRQAGWQISARELGDRDLRLFDALLEQLDRELCVDRTRVYSSGMSNGAYFSNLLGCQRATKLAGIAPTAGAGPFPAQCDTPMAVHLTHGRNDSVVGFAQVRKTLQTWATTNRCAVPSELPRSGCVSVEGCARPLELCVHPGEHIWPAGATEEIVGFLRGLASQ